MPVFYTNCHGQTYLIHERKTKTGKPCYYASMRTEGNLIEAVPEGYEVYERPGGRVSVRKIQKSLILPHELQFVQDQLAPLNDREYAFFRSALGEGAFILSSVKRLMLERHCFRWQAEIRGKEIIIYEVSCNGQPILKFVLRDEEERKYRAYRWCFRGMRLSPEINRQEILELTLDAFGKRVKLPWDQPVTHGGIDVAKAGSKNHRYHQTRGEPFVRSGTTGVSSTNRP